MNCIYCDLPNELVYEQVCRECYNKYFDRCQYCGDLVCNKTNCLIAANFQEQHALPVHNIQNGVFVKKEHILFYIITIVTLLVLFITK